VLCPRRGGAFKPTNDSRWAHAFCGRNAPGQTRVSQEGVVEIRLIPKECKKVKCSVCNRQQGACVRCAYLGCTTYFHPLCVERGGKGYLRTRLGEREAFCHQHIPEGVDRCEGYLVDGPEIHRLRISLDRSRVILDTLLRREKLKLRLCRLEGDHFASDFYRTLDRAKGRKHDTTLDSLEMGISESESEYGDEDDDEEGGSGDDENHEKSALPVVEIAPVVIPEVDLKKDKGKSKAKEKAAAAAAAAAAALDLIHCPINFKANKGDPITVMSKGRELLISSAWSNLKEVSLPRRLGVMVVGLPIQKKDIAIDGGRKAFLRILKEKIDGNLINSRLLNSIFGTQKEANDFAKKLGPSLLAHMAMSEADFSEAMGRMHIIAYPEFESMRQRQQAKALKLMQKKLKSEGDISSFPRNQALYDAPYSPEVLKKRKSSTATVQYLQEIDEDYQGFEEEEEEKEKADEMDVENHVGVDNDEDVDFNTSDFFMTDYEAEREIEMKASSAEQNAFSNSAAGPTSGKPFKPLSPDLKAMSKSKKPPRERVRKRDRNGKEKTLNKLSSSEAITAPLCISQKKGSAVSASQSLSPVTVNAPAALCPLDLSMVSVPVRGRKRDRERDAKRARAAAAAAAKRLGGSWISLSVTCLSFFLHVCLVLMPNTHDSSSSYVLLDLYTPSPSFLTI
jgi:PHD-zinc-finger like domain